MDSLLNPQSADKTPVWFTKPGCEPRVFPAHIARKLLADKNKGWVECEPDFVASKKIRPTDEGKTNQAVKNANTDKTGQQVAEFINQSVKDLRDYAKENEISLTGLTKKKEILEAIEEAGKLL